MFACGCDASSKSGAASISRANHPGYEASVGCGRAVVVGDRIVTSGTAPIWPDGSRDPDVTVQARRCLDIVFAALEQAGASPGDVIRTRSAEGARASASRSDAVALNPRQ
jgi:enamine deaminase RidA (YjgF/YER057c/UK114 family)